MFPESKNIHSQIIIIIKLGSNASPRDQIFTTQYTSCEKHASINLALHNITQS